MVGRQQRKIDQQRLRPSRASRVRGAFDIARRQSSGFSASSHPFTCVEQNSILHDYETRIKGSFDKIESVLREIAQYQHDSDFVSRAQAIANAQLGFALPESMLNNAWVTAVDMSGLYAWCVFESFCRFSSDFYSEKPLSRIQDDDFQGFIESCGFHTLDFSPCADGRLAHIIRYVLRLPYRGVRRKSYAGAMFDVDDSLQKWVETEYTRYREGVPNDSSSPTRYLKSAVYHYSSSKPDTEGCAAHGSDPVKAAEGALKRLLDFKQGVENSFCCGASIDLLLMGIDTDNDIIRIHLPDEKGSVDTSFYVDARDVYDATTGADKNAGERLIKEFVGRAAKARNIVPASGMLKLISRLLFNNISQIDYVRTFYQGRYSDIGHQERFIGMGIGFEEVQLRNLTYFAYLKTVEQGAKDLDVGIKIFTGLNINRGLPAPVIIRYDYHGNVPGERERAVERCKCLDQAMRNRFSEVVARGLLHTLLVVRDCNADQSIEVVGKSVGEPSTTGAH